MLFIFHLFNLEPDTLGRQVAELQAAHNLPGLIKTNNHHLVALDFENSRYMSKWQFKKLAKSYVNSLNKSQLLDKIKESKKIDYEQCVKEEYKRKEYFNELKLGDIRRRFRISSSMVEHVRGNYSNKYKGDSLSCQSCLKRNKQANVCSNTPCDCQNHILNICPSYDDLRLQYDTGTDIGIIQFYEKVIERRLEEGEV